MHIELGGWDDQDERQFSPQISEASGVTQYSWPTWVRVKHEISYALVHISACFPPKRNSGVTKIPPLPFNTEERAARLGEGHVIIATFVIENSLIMVMAYITW